MATAKKVNICKQFQSLRSYPQVRLLALILVFCSYSHANEANQNPMPAAHIIIETTTQETQLPGTEVTETVNITNTEQADNNSCKPAGDNRDIENRIKVLHSSLENDYKNGKAKELRSQIIQIRDDIDAITVKLFEIDSKNSELMNLISKQAIKNVEKLISLTSIIQKVAPQVRDDFVIPFAKITSLKAERPECFADDKSNIYRQLTSELNRLNQDLYTLQTMSIQDFISYKTLLISQLKIYNKNSERSIALTQEIPKILNSVHRDIELMLPGLELSGKYLGSL